MDTNGAANATTQRQDGSEPPRKPDPFRAIVVPLELFVKCADIGGMGFHDVASAVFVGNCLAIGFAWGIMQLNKHDYHAPWLAYAAVLMPIAYALASIALVEGLPPQFDGLALR